MTLEGPAESTGRLLGLSECPYLTAQDAVVVVLALLEWSG